MRTYDDTFSGEKIYPGKVRANPFLPFQMMGNEVLGEGGQ